MRNPKEGDIFKTIILHGKSFELRYGYYEDFERESEFGEPIPIYPDFLKSPQYSNEGYPFVTQMQEKCSDAIIFQNGDCCTDCIYYHHGEELLGLCKCEKKRILLNGTTLNTDVDSHGTEDIL